VEEFKNGERLSPDSYKEEELLAFINALLFTNRINEAKEYLQKVHNAKVKEQLKEKLKEAEERLRRSVLHHNYAVQLAKRRFFLSALEHVERSLLLNPSEKGEKLRLKLLLSLGEYEKFIRGAISFLFRSEDKEIENHLTSLTSLMLFRNRLLSSSLKRTLLLFVPLYLINLGVLALLLFK
jgi:tetratricopeptide (TPR) repeat protein